MSKSKSTAKKAVAKAEPEIRSCCPVCKKGKVAQDNGTRLLKNPLPHPNGGYLIGRRYFVCECGQNYVVPVIDRALGDEEAA